MAKKTSVKNKSTLTGTKAADVLTVKHSQVTVNAGAGRDRVNVNRGSGHKIYGEAGNDTIIVAAKAGSGSKFYGDDAKNKLTGKDTFTINGGKKNYFYGGKGVDTFNVNGGSTNYIYGGAGNDVIVIGKNSKGRAIVKDFSVKKGNTDRVRVVGGAVKNIAVSGKNMIIKGGKSASLTLQNAKNKTFTVTDALGKYTVTGADVKLALGKNVTGTVAVASFVTAVDGRRNANAVTIKGNAKNNVIYGGAGKNYLYGGAGNDVLYGGAGNDTLTGGTGKDVFWYNDGNGFDTITDYTSGEDIIKLGSGTIKKIVYGDNDTILSVGQGTITVKNSIGNAITVKYKDGTKKEFMEEVDVNNLTVALAEDYSDYTFSLEDFNKSRSQKAVNIDAHAVTDYKEIYGDNHANIIWATNGGSYIYAGKGNDVIIAGNGVDRIYYEANGGNDTIYAFDSGDSIHFNGNPNGPTMKDISLNGNDLIVNLTNSNAITLKNAREKGITFYGYDFPSFGGGKTYGRITISNNTAVLKSDFDGNFYLTDYSAKPINIDARACDNWMELNGDGRSNIIYASKGGGHIYAGKGNDTIYLSDEEHYLHYEMDGGNDTVYNFKSGDTILFGSDENDPSFKNVLFRGNDMVLCLTNGGTITLKNAVDEMITFRGYHFAEETTYGKVSISNDSAILHADYEGEFRLTDYLVNPVNINATASNRGLTLHGDDRANMIFAGNGGGYIYGGKGNDVIYFGDSKDNYYTPLTHNYAYIYNKGDGNDVIYNFSDSDLYSEQDRLFFEDCAITSTFRRGNDVVLNIDSGGSVTLKDVIGKTVFISDSNDYSFWTFASDDIPELNAINGTFASDTLTVTVSDVTVNAGSGNDTINIVSGNRNVIHGNEGNDTIIVYNDAGTGNKIYGDAGDDIIKVQGNGNQITVYGGDGSDTIYGGAGNDLLYGQAGNDKLFGGSGDDKLYGQGGDDTLTGGTGKDTFVYSNGGGKDIITDYTASDDTIQIASGSISKTELANNTDVKFAIGNGSITLQNGADKIINVRDSRGSYLLTKNSIMLQKDFTGTLDANNYFNTLTNIDGSWATKALTIKGNGKTNTIYGGSGNDVLQGGAGNDNLHGGSGKDIFRYDSGNDTIYDFEIGTDKIHLASVALNKGEIKENDVLLTLSNGGTITVKNAANQTIDFIDSNGNNLSITPATQQGVIKKFMQSLDITDKLTNSADAALNDAVLYASGGMYPTWDALINSFVNDVREHGGADASNQYGLVYDLETGQYTPKEDTNNFLINYCGIDLGNADTGAITGWDVGGSVIKTAESIVPENGTIANLATPLSSVTSIEGVNFLWPTINGDTQQTIIDMLYTWWSKESLQLIEESYGLSFKENGTTVHDIDVVFCNENNDNLAYINPTYSLFNSGIVEKLTLKINLRYINNIISDNVNGKTIGGSSLYIDRLVAHELTHAVMMANITGFKNLPKSLVEGTAELVHGVDDSRIIGIGKYAQKQNVDTLMSHLTTLNYPDKNDYNYDADNVYAAGYMLLRYLAKQVSDGSGTRVLASTSASNSSGGIELVPGPAWLGYELYSGSESFNSGSSASDSVSDASLANPILAANTFDCMVFANNSIPSNDQVNIFGTSKTLV